MTMPSIGARMIVCARLTSACCSERAALLDLRFSEASAACD
jgi:hypothetical protein